MAPARYIHIKKQSISIFRLLRIRQRRRRRLYRERRALRGSSRRQAREHRGHGGGRGCHGGLRCSQRGMARYSRGQSGVVDMTETTLPPPSAPARESPLISLSPALSDQRRVSSSPFRLREAAVSLALSLTSLALSPASAVLLHTPPDRTCARAIVVAFAEFCFYNI